MEKSSSDILYMQIWKVATVPTKMEFFDQVTLCLGILEMKTNGLVAEARALYGE